MESGQDLSTRIHSLARRLFAEAKREGRLGTAMHRLILMAERESRRAVNSLPVACAAGCSACCRLNVSVLFPEAAAIFAYFRRRFPPRVREETAGRLEAHYWHLSWLGDEAAETVLLPAPCAFLDAQGRCSIHPVRPLLCRSITSTTAESCRQAIALQDSAGRAVPIVMNLRHKAIMETAFVAVGRTLEEVGLDGRGYPLSLAVYSLFRDPGETRRFLAGNLPRV